MKKALVLVELLIALAVLGCSKDYSPYSYSNESTIYSETNKINFRELLVILKPYLMVDNQKKYILTVVEEKFKIKPQIIIKMGDKVDEIIKFLKEDKSIRFLVLASSTDSDPGPIIKSLSKKMNDLSVPLVIIPGLISEKEIDNLI